MRLPSWESLSCGKRPDADRPYKAFGYPILPALYILMAVAFCILLIIYKPEYTWPGLIIVLSGIPIYYIALANQKSLIDEQRHVFDSLFDSFNRLKIGVIGDVMLDTYWWGKVDRISPEAPVPVVAVTKREQRIGGAGNVALNIRALGAKCACHECAGCR